MAGNAEERMTRATGARIPVDKIAAARLRVKLGEQLNDPAPGWVHRLAEHNPANDYGPIPMSRLTEEAGKVFTALAQGRRVLVSHRGMVIAAMGPPYLTETLDQIKARERTLAEFERDHPDATPEEFAQAVEATAETPEEGVLYYVHDIRSHRGDIPELARFRSGEFLFFGTDDSAYPNDVEIVTKVKVVEGIPHRNLRKEGNDA